MANKEVTDPVTGEATDEVLDQQPLEDRNGGALAAVRSPINNTEMQKLMNTDAAQSVLQNGYPKEIVQKAIERLLMTEGSAFMSGTKIMETIFHIEEEEERGGMELPSASGGKEFTANEISRHGTEGGANACKTSAQEMILKKYQEYQELQDATLCKICLDNIISVVFLPCSHLVTCKGCSSKVRICPICRSLVRATANAYFK